MRKNTCDRIVIGFANGVIAGPFEASTEKEILEVVEAQHKEENSKPEFVYRCHSSDIFSIKQSAQYTFTKCD
jgi:hypothetical protein